MTAVPSQPMLVHIFDTEDDAGYWIYRLADDMEYDREGPFRTREAAITAARAVEA